MAFANSMATVLVCRFFMGATGASILSNSPGMLNDSAFLLELLVSRIQTRHLDLVSLLSQSGRLESLLFP